MNSVNDERMKAPLILEGTAAGPHATEPDTRNAIRSQRHLGHVALQSAPLALGLLALLLAPVFLSDFRLSLLAKFLTYAIVALAIDLVWGYAGMLSLGHGVFFGLGGYAFAMYLKQEASRGALPDFMSWSGLTELPVFWAPFANAWFAIPMTMIIPAAVAGLVGYMVFNSRITGVYFSIITQALALIVSILFIGQQPYTGGTNGITNFQTIFGRALILDDVRLTLYYVTVAVLVLSFLLSRWLISSRFGWLLVALRDDENRVRFIGYNPAHIKTAILMFSAALSGVAGALFATQVGIISPALIGIVPSIEMVVWVAVGGRGTLVGPIVGAILVSAAKSSLSEGSPDYWSYYFGALFIGSVLVFPQGIVGGARQLSSFVRRRRPGYRRV